jgi:hypothetical protein
MHAAKGVDVDAATGLFVFAPTALDRETLGLSENAKFHVGGTLEEAVGFVRGFSDAAMFARMQQKSEASVANAGASKKKRQTTGYARKGAKR